MPQAEIDQDDHSKITVESGYQDRFLIKQLPGSRWDANRKVWTAPTSWSSCVILRGLFQNQLEIGENLRSWAKTERAVRVDAAKSLRERLNIDDEDSPAAKVIRSWR